MEPEEGDNSDVVNGDVDDDNYSIATSYKSALTHNEDEELSCEEDIESRSPTPPLRHPRQPIRVCSLLARKRLENIFKKK
jgi:hypothetical protein